MFKFSRKERKVLLTVSLLAIGLHTGALFLLHNLSLSIGSSWRTIGSFSQIPAADLEMKNRYLAEIFQTEELSSFDHLQELKELHVENSSSSLLQVGHEVQTLHLPQVSLTFDEALEQVALTTIEQNELPHFELGEALPSAPPCREAPEAQLSFQADPLDSYGSIAGSDHFDITVEYAPKYAGPGYVFKVTFTPKKEVVFKRIRHNVTFLIDRSNSIPKARYQLNKQAVAAALPHLLQGDTFNLLIFDDQVVRFSPQMVATNPENIQNALAFLNQQGHGGIFASTDLYSSLGKILPRDVPDNEVNTAILLSDGDTFLPVEKQRQMIGEWTAQNHGKVTLFSVASGVGNNLPLLELMSLFNKGALVYAQHHEGMAEQMVNLLSSLARPIGKDLIATAVCTDRQATISLQPRNARLPNLYQNRTFSLFGSTNRLSDFILFIQGKYYGTRFDIKKKISFKEAESASLVLERQWTELEAQDYFDRYFRDGQVHHLHRAAELLAPLNLSVPFL